MPSRLPIAHLCLGVLYAVLLVLAVSVGPDVAELTRVVLGLIGLVAAVRAARFRGPAHRAWLAVAVSFAVLVLSPVLRAALTAIGVRAADDVTHVTFVLSLLVALRMFPLARMNRRERWKSAIDATTVLVGGTMVLWYTSFGGQAERNLLISAGLFPLSDLALLFVASRVLLRGADDTAQRPLRWLVAGSIVLFAADAMHGYLVTHNQIDFDAPWQILCWITADALLAGGALAQITSRTAQTRGLRPSVPVARFLPYAAVAVAHILMAVAAVQEGTFFPWGGLALGGAALSGLVLFRQTLVQRESDEQAITDHLTGLPNRSLFRLADNRALARAAQKGRHSAVLVIDMNGFKEVNDTLGHKSGDLVLVEFAEVLRRCVPVPGRPCRLGGDEFAVVLPDLGNPEDAYEVAARIAAAVAPIVIDGQIISMAASIGVAVSGPGELTHDEIVHRADQAMYQAKKLSPQTRWTAWHESLEQPLAA